jgi:hypothetical protein
VHHAQLGAAPGGSHTQHGTLRLDGVADIDIRTEAHIDVLEIGASILRDVFHRLAEGHRHDEPRRHGHAGIAVQPCEVQVLVQRIGAEREVGEVGGQALGQGAAPLVPEYLTEPEILEEVA